MKTISQVLEEKGGISNIFRNSKPECACCNQKFCDGNGSRKPFDQKLKLQWEKCKKENWCPQCRYDCVAPFWLRDDGIECCRCR